MGSDDRSQGGVSAAVSDEQYLPTLGRRDFVENGPDPRHEGQDALLLVLNRHDDGQERRDHAALDELRAQVADRRRRSDREFLALSGHGFLPWEGRLGRNGLRDLYFSPATKLATGGRVVYGTRRFRSHGRARPASLVVPGAAQNPEAPDRTRRPTA